MSDAIQVLLTRRTVRAYEPRPVPREELETIVKCGTYAATSRGGQAFHFTVVTNQDLLDRISEATRKVLQPEDAHYHNFYHAPAVIFVSGEQAAANAGMPDCANATENMALAAKALGLGSCYIASHKNGLLGPEGAPLCKELGIPQGYAPQFALAVGYAVEEVPAAPRRENLVNWVE